jgi:F0F1-type ATP synthase membrane subunit b/b'
VQTVEQKAQATIKNMKEKAHTTVEKAKQAIEQDGADCDFSNLAG